MKDILIVEDDAPERENLRRLLAAAGFVVAAAESAAEAEGKLAVDRFRLLILDIGLTDRSGSYLFDIARKLSSPPAVFILTGNPSVHLKQQFVEEGAAAFVVKGSPEAESGNLLAAVRAVLGASSGNALSGLPLGEFLRLYAAEYWKAFFLNEKGELPECPSCRHREYVVSFNHKPQIPPLVEGLVRCVHCGAELDPQIV